MKCLLDGLQQYQCTENTVHSVNIVFVVLILCSLCPQSRKLDVYFEFEEKLMSKSTLDKSLLDIISDPDGTHTNTLTLIIIYHTGISAKSVTASVF